MIQTVTDSMREAWDHTQRYSIQVHINQGKSVRVTDSTREGWDHTQRYSIQVHINQGKSVRDRQYKGGMGPQTTV